MGKVNGACLRSIEMDGRGEMSRSLGDGPWIIIIVWAACSPCRSPLSLRYDRRTPTCRGEPAPAHRERTRTALWYIESAQPDGRQLEFPAVLPHLEMLPKVCQQVTSSSEAGLSLVINVLAEE